MRPGPNCPADSGPPLLPAPARPQNGAANAPATVRGVCGACFRSHQGPGDDFQTPTARGSPTARASNPHPPRALAAAAHTGPPAPVGWGANGRPRANTATVVAQF